MTLSLAQLKQQFAEADNKRTNWNSGEWYPFWKMEYDQVAIVRFLPDEDPNASHFLIEKWMHELYVTIDGKEEKRNVPCLQMYGESCPICKTSKKFYDENDEDNGKRFYKRKSWLGQVIVVNSPFDYDDPDQQPKLISLNKQLYDSIKAAIMRGDLKHMPTDLKNGYDFRIFKTRNGKWAAYSTSAFTPEPSAVDEEVLSNLTPHVLKSKLPKKPNLDTVEDMLSSALTGSAYVAPKNSSNDAPSSYSATDSSTASNKKNDDDAGAPWEEKATTTQEEPVGSSEADEILAAIAARRNKA